MRRHFENARAGFMLLEAMLAALIFGLAVLSLSASMNNCFKAERFRRSEGLAQRVLANYQAQIETEALPLADTMTEELKGAWAGMTMNITREQMKLQNEKEQEIFGIYKVTLDVSWAEGRETSHRTLAFYFYPKQR